VVADMGTTTPYVFNSASNTVIGVARPGPLAFNSLTVSNAIISTGQVQTLTAYVTNGLGPYTYLIAVYNSLGEVAAQLGASPLTYNSFAFVQDPSWGAGTFTVNVLVQDSNVLVATVTNTLYYTYTATGLGSSIAMMITNSTSVSTTTVPTTTVAPTFENATGSAPPSTTSAPTTTVEPDMRFCSDGYATAYDTSGDYADNYSACQYQTSYSTSTPDAPN